MITPKDIVDCQHPMVQAPKVDKKLKDFSGSLSHPLLKIFRECFKINCTNVSPSEFRLRCPVCKKPDSIIVYLQHPHYPVCSAVCGCGIRRQLQKNNTWLNLIRIVTGKNESSIKDEILLFEYESIMKMGTQVISKQSGKPIPGLYHMR